ncbi:MAG: hypothetical protein GY751_00345 [Bacteroidetes bacterium]|nr:hypothetical protein [Bacteroidota bacterium]
MTDTKLEQSYLTLTPTPTQPSQETVWIDSANGQLHRGDFNLELGTVVNYTARVQELSISSQVIPANTVVQLTNWTVDSGALPGFDPVTGIFTVPFTGIYSFSFFVGITTGSNRTEVELQIFDPVGGDTNYISNMLTSDLSQPFEGAITFGYTALLNQNNQNTINVRLNNIETCTFRLELLRIM